MNHEPLHMVPDNFSGCLTLRPDPTPVTAAPIDDGDPRDLRVIAILRARDRENAG